ncbi:MAG TPA: CBS domain-containing protein, partial [Bacteroidia bacterium]|nr:CBS domain-containing protein [Bacteroidia bacterium]
VKTPGGIIILNVERKNYSMQEIARITESNGALILSSSVNQLPDSEIFEVTLKVDKLDLSRILAGFYRMDYNVVASYQTTDLPTDIEDRYQAFMTYLNV